MCGHADACTAGYTSTSVGIMNGNREGSLVSFTKSSPSRQISLTMAFFRRNFVRRVFTGVGVRDPGIDRNNNLHNGFFTQRHTLAGLSFSDRDSVFLPRVLHRRLDLFSKAGKRGWSASHHYFAIFNSFSDFQSMSFNTLSLYPISLLYYRAGCFFFATWLY